MTKPENGKYGEAKLASVVVFMIKNAGRVLLFGPDEDGAWGFPSEEFDNGLNGGLEDTASRSLRNILGAETGIEAYGARCIGSFVAKRGNLVEAVYVFSADMAEDGIARPHVWVVPEELGRMELDLRTAAFLKSCGGFIET
jgi:hypothetical protein